MTRISAPLASFSADKKFSAFGFSACVFGLRMVYCCQLQTEVPAMYSFSFVRFSGYGFMGHGFAVVRA